jgi:hypothetical protein
MAFSQTKKKEKKKRAKLDKMLLKSVSVCLRVHRNVTLNICESEERTE